jgi:hypothetical protein
VFWSTVNRAVLTWVEKNVVLLLLRRVPVYLFVVYLITPSVSLVLRRLMNSVRFEVPTAVLGIIQVLGGTLYRLLKGLLAFDGL